VRFAKPLATRSLYPGVGVVLFCPILQTLYQRLSFELLTSSRGLGFLSILDRQEILISGKNFREILLKLIGAFSKLNMLFNKLVA
jgi:hypothetical protein